MAAERVNRRVLKGKLSVRPGNRPLADHGIPLVPVPGQLDLFENSQLPQTEESR